jgi:hypothetical protein
MRTLFLGCLGPDEGEGERLGIVNREEVGYRLRRTVC